MLYSSLANFVKCKQTSGGRMKHEMTRKVKLKEKNLRTNRRTQTKRRTRRATQPTDRPTHTLRASPVISSPLERKQKTLCGRGRETEKRKRRMRHEKETEVDGGISPGEGDDDEIGREWRRGEEESQVRELFKLEERGECFPYPVHGW